MQEKELEALLDGYFSLASRFSDTDLAVVAAALFLEQTFGIELSDADITVDTLGTPEAVRRLVFAGGDKS